MLKQLNQKEGDLVAGGDKNSVDLSGGGNSENANVRVQVNFPVNEQVTFSPYVDTHNGQPTGGGMKVEWRG